MREVARLEMELKRAKFTTRQVEKNPFSLSMNAMAKAIKVLQTLVVNERETNIQLSLELKEVQKEKGVGPNGKTTKAMKTQTLDLFMGKDIRAKRVK